jgi:hypothetical protein
MAFRILNIHCLIHLELLVHRTRKNLGCHFLLVVSLQMAGIQISTVSLSVLVPSFVMTVVSVIRFHFHLL